MIELQLLTHFHSLQINVLQSKRRSEILKSASILIYLIYQMIIAAAAHMAY